MNKRTMHVGDVEYEFCIPPRLAGKVLRDDLDFLVEFAQNVFPINSVQVKIFFRQSVQGCNGSPYITIRDHAVDSSSGTVGAVLQLARDRRFQISFAVPKGFRKQDFAKRLSDCTNGSKATDRDAEKRGGGEVRQNSQVVVEPVTMPQLVTGLVPDNNHVLSAHDLPPVTSVSAVGNGEEQEHPTINVGRFTKLLSDPSTREKISVDLTRHANPDGSIDCTSISAVLAVHTNIVDGDMIAPAYNALVSTVHHAPLLEREVLPDGTKRYWLPGKLPKSETPVQVTNVPVPSSMLSRGNDDESAVIIEGCKNGLEAFRRLLGILDHVSASTAQVSQLREELARAVYDRDHNSTELEKASREIEKLKVTVEGLDRVIAENRDEKRRCIEIARELEIKKAQLTDCREENQRLLEKLKGMRAFLEG